MESEVRKLVRIALTYAESMRYTIANERSKNDPKTARPRTSKGWQLAPDAGDPALVAADHPRRRADLEFEGCWI